MTTQADQSEYRAAFFRDTDRSRLTAVWLAARFALGSLAVVGGFVALVVFWISRGSA